MAIIERNASMIPVTIIDGMTTVYEYAGATYTCSAAPSSAVVGLHFQHNKAHRQFIRWPIDCTITSVTTTNLTSYDIWVNDVLVTPLSLPLSMTQGDRVYTKITHVGGGNAQVDLTCLGISSPIIYNSQDYFYPRTMIHKENVKTLTNWMHFTDQSLIGDGNTASFQTNCVWGDGFKNTFTYVYEPGHWNFTGQLTFGLNDLSLPYNTVNRYPRMRYCIMLDANAVKIWEFGVLKTTVALPYNQVFSYRILSKENPAGSGIFTIGYFYSNDNETTWTLLYSSTLAQNGLDLYPDFATQGGYYVKHHPPKLLY